MIALEATNESKNVLQQMKFVHFVKEGEFDEITEFRN
jgi:hypothetical protein